MGQCIKRNPSRHTVSQTVAGFGRSLRRTLHRGFPRPIGDVDCDAPGFIATEPEAQ